MEPSGFRVQQIDHIELVVPDQYEAAAWYRRVLGLEIAPELEHHAAEGPLMIRTPEGDSKLALFRGSPAAASTHTGIKRIAFRTDGGSFLEFLDRLAGLALRGKGGQVTAADAVDHVDCFSIYFDDPWGYPIEITTYDYQLVAAR